MKITQKIKMLEEKLSEIDKTISFLQKGGFSFDILEEVFVARAELKKLIHEQKRNLEIKKLHKKILQKVNTILSERYTIVTI